MFDRARFVDSLKQQRLPSHHGPSLTPTCLLTFVFLLGIFCIGVGQLFNYAASQIIEVKRYYHNETINKTVNISIELNGFQGQDIYVYYQLEGFSQMALTRDERGTRRHAYDFEHFAKGDYSYICTGETEDSRKVRMEVDIVADSTFIKDNPLTSRLRSIYIPNRREEQSDVSVPCGVRANLFFNDTFKLVDSNGTVVPFTEEGINWKPKELPWKFPWELLLNDAGTAYFKNPPGFNPKQPCELFHQTFDNGSKLAYPKPSRWTTHICNMTGAMENEDFIAWMTPSYGSTFRKPWRKLSGKHSYQLHNGTYRVVMNNYWLPYSKNDLEEYDNVTTLPFAFRKAIVFTTVNWAGGKNNFLGVAYTVVGVIILFIGCGLALLQSFYPSYLHEESEEIRWRKNA